AMAVLPESYQRALTLAIDVVSATLSHGEAVLTQAEEALRTVLITPGVERVPTENSGRIVGMAFSESASLVLIAGAKGVIFTHSTVNDANTIKLRLRRSLRHASFDASGRMVATCREDGTANVWDLQS